MKAVERLSQNWTRSDGEVADEKNPWGTFTFHTGDIEDISVVCFITSLNFISESVVWFETSKCDNRFQPYEKCGGCDWSLHWCLIVYNVSQSWYLSEGAQKSFWIPFTSSPRSSSSTEGVHALTNLWADHMLKHSQPRDYHTWVWLCVYV